MRGLALLLGALALTACGGSKSTSTASTSTAAVTIPPISTSAPETGTQTTVTLTKTAPATTTKTTPTGSINVRVPARFTILAGGTVSPPTITIPAHLPVELIVVSNGQPHRVTLRTTTLTVKGHAPAEALIDGLKTGSYPLKVDGATRAVLTIGGEPGP